MAITSAICTSFKQEILVEGHNLTNGADSIKLALYTSSATLGAGTTAFVTTGQATGTNYSSGGSALTNVTPTTSGTTAIVDFADLTFLDFACLEEVARVILAIRKMNKPNLIILYLNTLLKITFYYKLLGSETF